MIGRKEIEHQHAYPFTTVLKEARLYVKSYRSKWITDEIVSVDIKWGSTGHSTPEGSLFQPSDMAYSIAVWLSDASVAILLQRR